MTILPGSRIGRGLNGLSVDRACPADGGMSLLPHKAERRAVDPPVLAEQGSILVEAAWGPSGAAQAIDCRPRSLKLLMTHATRSEILN